MFNKKNEKGFTLIELIVVIAIIAILAAVVVPNMFSLTDKAKESSTKAMASAIVASAHSSWAQAIGTAAAGVYPVPECVPLQVLLDEQTDWVCTNTAADEAGYISIPEATAKFSLISDPDYQVFYHRVAEDEEEWIVTYSYNDGENAVKAGGNLGATADVDGIPD